MEQCNEHVLRPAVHLERLALTVGVAQSADRELSWSHVVRARVPPRPCHLNCLIVLLSYIKNFQDAYDTPGWSQNKFPETDPAH
jgi:hypothetical protein